MAPILIRLALAAVVIATAAGCGHPTPTSNTPSDAEREPSRLLAGGRYDVTMGDAVQGAEPFEITWVTVSLEVTNNTDAAVVPRCALWYGSQVAPIETGEDMIEPKETRWLTGQAEFLRPLDDYESGSAGCFTRLRRSTERDIERQREAMRVGRPTVVPDLAGLKLDARLPNFRRGLDIRIARENTPCDKKKLMKMSRYVNPFGKPPCAGPVIAKQHPPPGTETTVGEHIRVTVVASRR